MTSLDQLQQSAADALRRYMAGEGDRTEHLREVATRFVEAREHFFTKEGEPDWLGRSYIYRRWLRDTYSLANVPPSDLSTIQAAVRYHTGNVLRDGRLDEQTMRDLGLRAESPRERSIEKRSNHSITLGLFGAGGAELRTSDEILTALHMMDVALRRVSLEAVANLTVPRRREVANLADSIAELIAGIRSAARA
jgi:hypothetical protein